MDKQKTISGVVTLLVLSVLVLAGPAQAFVSSLSVFDDSVEKGEKIMFNAELDLEGQDVSEIDKITLNIYGPENRSCNFDSAGNKIDGCEGMQISLISDFGYGYGYGYGYGGDLLKYKIILNSGSLEIGNYTTELVTMLNGDSATQEGDDFEIVGRNKKVEVCHVPPGNPENEHTISISEDAVDAHLAHGDYLGECENEKEHGNSGNDDEEDEEHGQSGEHGNSGNDDENEIEQEDEDDGHETELEDEEEENSNNNGNGQEKKEENANDNSNNHDDSEDEENEVEAESEDNHNNEGENDSEADNEEEKGKSEENKGKGKNK